jgi:hypothetical protein
MDGIVFVGPDGKSMSAEEFKKQVKNIKISKTARSIADLRAVIHHAIMEAMKQSVPIESIVGALEMEKSRFLDDMNDIQRKVQEQLFKHKRNYELTVKDNPPEEELGVFKPSNKEPDYIG